MPAPKFLPVAPRMTTTPPGHVLAGVFSHAFHHCRRSRVTNGKAFTGASRREQKASRGSVQGDVAQDDLRLARLRQFAYGTKNEFAARQSFADVVVGRAL